MQQVLYRLSPFPSPSKSPLFNVNFLCVQLKAKIFDSWVTLCLPNQLLSPLLPQRISVIAKPLFFKRQALPHLAFSWLSGATLLSSAAAATVGSPDIYLLCSGGQDSLPVTPLQFHPTRLKAWSWQNICSLPLSLCIRAFSARFPAGQKAAYAAGGWAPAGCLTLDFLMLSVSRFLTVLGEFHAVS